MMKNIKPLPLIIASIALLAGCNEEGTSQTSSTANDAGQSASAPAEQCANCGTVTAIDPVTVKGGASGAGAAIGAVVGGLLGNEVGGGSGKKLATAVGVVGGAAAGNEVEKQSNAQTYYDISVEMDSGGVRTISVANPAGLSIGDDVKVSGNNIEMQ